MEKIPLRSTQKTNASQISSKNVKKLTALIQSTMTYYNIVPAHKV